MTYKEKRKIYMAKYLAEHRDKVLEYKARYRVKNRKKILEDGRKYGKLHRERISEYLAKRRLEPLFRLKANLKCRTRNAFRRINMNKPAKTEELLGTDYMTVKKHIERQFTKGMCWDKLGGEIHLDHIIPLSSAKDSNELIKLCHYSNLQPLWAVDNFRKHDKLNFEVNKPFDDEERMGED